MEYIDPKGEIAIYSGGDLVYQPMKIKNLGFTRYIDEMYVFEKKNDMFEQISKIYEGRRIIVVDDKVTDLEIFNNFAKEAITIHLKRGSYSKLSPIKDVFRSAYTVGSVEELLEVIKNMYLS